MENYNSIFCFFEWISENESACKQYTIVQLYNSTIEFQIGLNLDCIKTATAISIKFPLVKQRKKAENLFFSSPYYKTHLYERIALYGVVKVYLRSTIVRNAIGLSLVSGSHALH